MTDKDIETQEENALAKCLRLRANLFAVKGLADQKAREMEALAHDLRAQPGNISVGSYEWLLPDKITRLVADIALAEQELAVANDEAAVLGVTLPPLQYPHDSRPDRRQRQV